MENELKEPIELFGYECGPGWMPLIEKAQEIIDEWNERHPDNEHGPLKFSQVKEKWGLLCMYLNFYPDEETEEAIIMLENESKHYCEQCGSEKDVKTERTHGWIMTLCTECRTKELERYKNIAKETMDTESLGQLESLIKLLTENHNMIKKFNIEFSAPDVVKSFNVEYFSVKMPEFPGGIICD